MDEALLRCLGGEFLPIEEYPGSSSGIQPSGPSEELFWSSVLSGVFALLVEGGFLGSLRRVYLTSLDLIPRDFGVFTTSSL